MKFIYLCAGILVFSFTALPALFGISAERDQIVNVAAIEPAAGNAGPAETETGFTSGFNRDNYPAF